eukprot:scaffold86169_cov46-Attheya_sp.AAC.1
MLRKKRDEAAEMRQSCVKTHVGESPNSASAEEEEPVKPLTMVHQEEEQAPRRFKEQDDTYLHVLQETMAGSGRWAFGVAAIEIWIEQSDKKRGMVDRGVEQTSGLAALLPGGKLDRPELKGKNIVVPLCGGNIDTMVLGRVLDRGLASDERLVNFVATVSDRPGGIARLMALLAEQGASIKDIYHESAWLHSSVDQV